MQIISFGEISTKLKSVLQHIQNKKYLYYKLSAFIELVENFIAKSNINVS